MNTLHRKPIHIAVTAILFCIIYYGIGSAKPICFSEITDKCFQASTRTKCDLMVDFRYGTTVPGQPRQHLLPATTSSCCDPLDTCCKAPESSASIPAALNLTRTSDSSDSSGSAHTIATGLDRPEITEHKPAQTHVAILPLKTPLYIQLRSILC
ncbi:MAG: hypothetical protein JRI76_09490 [Deltaproteobacteria bacterium]|nr:hypothetical protein [Deltaproteobacteria bacterium]MBW2042252.1 hypothetical protein [Deltaproteobacteria bacterium]